MQGGLVLLLCGACCGLGAFAFPEGREKRKSDTVVVEVLPVVVYEVPPIPSVLAFDFDGNRKAKSKGKETKETNNNKEEKKEETTKKVVKRGFKLDEKDDFKEDIKEQLKIELKGHGKAKIEEKFEEKIHNKESEKFKF